MSIKDIYYVIRALIGFTKYTPEEVCSECPDCGSPYCSDKCEFYGTFKG